MNKEEFVARCHCGKLQGTFRCNPKKVVALDCNCSDCGMRKNVHVVVPQADFDLPENLHDVTILYQWGTKTAIRRFCKTCGVLPWYHPRSNPDGVAITIHCVDWTKGGTLVPPEIEIVQVDGLNWEEMMKEKGTRISQLSKE